MAQHTIQRNAYVGTTFECAPWTAQPEGTRYLVFQKEKCPKTGKLHLQFYVELTRSQRIAKVKKILGRECHLEVRKGSRTQARDYCMKTDTRVSEPVEFGELPNSAQGKRNDLVLIRDKLKNGSTPEDIAEDYPGLYFRYYRGFENYFYKTLKHRKRDPPPNVTVLYGPAGSGKSSYVYTLTDNDDEVYFKSSGNRWWEGYNQQIYVILDDFHSLFMEFKDLLRLLDRYQLQVEIKGGSIPFNSPNIIITSDEHPENWYPFKDENDKAQLLRRITKIIKTPEALP